jgi:hypothetical protein
MTDQKIDSPSDLEHPWPLDIFHYETRFFLGFKIEELLMLSLPLIGGLMWLGVVGAVIGTALGFLLMKRFESMGNRSVISYLAARFKASRQTEDVMLPLVMPEGASGVSIESWGGEEILRIGDDG